MRYLSQSILLLFFSVSIMAGSREGIAPRGSASDYPAHTEVEDFALGASLLTAEQVRSNFASDLNRGYIVVEVSIYPKTGTSLEVARRDFILRKADGGILARPSDPKTVAAILQKTALPKFTWKVLADGALQVQPQDKPAQVYLWRAENPKARDFRVDTIGNAYVSSRLEERPGGTYVGRVPKPPEGFTAFFVELVYDGGGKFPFKFTTDVSVVPDRLPYTLKPFEK